MLQAIGLQAAWEGWIHVVVLALHAALVPVHFTWRLSRAALAPADAGRPWLLHARQPCLRSAPAPPPPSRLEYNFFISLPLATLEVRAAAEAFKQSVLAEPWAAAAGGSAAAA